MNYYKAAGDRGDFSDQDDWDSEEEPDREYGGRSKEEIMLQTAMKAHEDDKKEDRERKIVDEELRKKRLLEIERARQEKERLKREHEERLRARQEQDEKLERERKEVKRNQFHALKDLQAMKPKRLKKLLLKIEGNPQWKREREVNSMEKEEVVDLVDSWMAPRREARARARLRERAQQAKEEQAKKPKRNPREKRYPREKPKAPVQNRLDGWIDQFARCSLSDMLNMINYKNKLPSDLDSKEPSVQKSLLKKAYKRAIKKIHPDRVLAKSSESQYKAQEIAKVLNPKFNAKMQELGGGVI